MALALTTNAKVAIAKGGTWPAAATLGSGHRLPIKSTSFGGEPGVLPNDTLAETAERLDHDLIETKADGDIVTLVDYRQALLLWATFMGSAGTPAEVEASFRYRHTFAWQPSAAGLYFTYGMHGDVGATKALKVAASKVAQLSLTGSVGNRLEATWGCLGGVVTRADDPSAWSYANSPAAGGGRHVLFRAGVLRVNASSGGALGSGDALNYFRAFTLNVNRNYGDLDFQQNGVPIDPAPGGFADLTLKLDFYGADGTLFDLLRDAKDNATPLKLDYTFTGPSLGGGNYEMRLFMPRLLVTSAPLPITQPGRVPFSVDFTLHKGGSVPTGFPTGYDEALTVDVVNELTADVLA